jgi:hypothetical protein
MDLLTNHLLLEEGIEILTDMDDDMMSTMMITDTEIPTDDDMMNIMIHTTIKNFFHS